MTINRKGIILAGGSGTRLHPLTYAMSKQLLPVYDKPMIYYALSTLMISGIRDILIISTKQHIGLFQQLLGDGESLGISLTYATQDHPNGIAEAFIIGETFIDNNPSALILGDNIFWGHDLYKVLQEANFKYNTSTVFAYHVNDPERYGVIEFDASSKKVLQIHEKPTNPPSNYAVTGLYFYDNNASLFAKSLSPSDRNELEITDLNKLYLNTIGLQVELLGRGIAWLDTGTHESLLEAGQFISTIEKRQGFKIGCPEEVAWRSGWITNEQLQKLAYKLKKTEYGQYLNQLTNTQLVEVQMEYNTILCMSDDNRPYGVWSDNEKQSFEIKLTSLIQEINDVFNDNTPKSND